MSSARVFVLAMVLAGCAHEPPPPPEPATPPPAEVAAPAAAEPPAPEPAVEAAAAPEPIPRPEQVDGPYKVSVASERTTQLAGPWVRKLEAEGLRVAVEPATVGDVTWQRVVLPGLRNGREARAMAAYLDQQLGMKSWVVPKNPASAKPQGEHPGN